MNATAWRSVHGTTRRAPEAAATGGTASANPSPPGARDYHDREAVAGRGLVRGELVVERADKVVAGRHHVHACRREPAAEIDERDGVAIRPRDDEAGTRVGRDGQHGLRESRLAGRRTLPEP